MSTTGTDRDVVAANTYSRSLLHVVAQSLAEQDERIDYFPSYEMVTGSPRGLAWQSDQLHVTPKMVEFVVGRFIADYLA